MRVLLVDDDPMTLEVLRKALENSGHEVFTCDSGYDALCVLEKESYDCVICDVIMPELSGLVVANIITHYFGSSLPLILMSSNKNVRFYVENYSSPQFEFIEKPVQIPALLNKVNGIGMRNINPIGLS